MLALTIILLDESAILDIIEEVRKSFNGLDIVVHNAGITRDKTLGKMPQHHVAGMTIWSLISMAHNLPPHHPSNPPRKMGQRLFKQKAL